MGKIVAIANQKGGVGKTTTSINLASGLAYLNKKILLIDLDPQGNATQGLGYTIKPDDLTVYDIMLNNASVKEAIIKLRRPPLNLLATNINLAGADLEMVDIEKRESILKNKLSEIKNDYDFIIIDCPPSLGLLNTNALTAADSVIIPVQCEYYALEGVTQLLNTIKLVQRVFNPKLIIEGVLLTMFDTRTKLSVEVAQEVRKEFRDITYTTLIPRNVRLSESPSLGQSIFEYAINSEGAKSYIALAKEFIIRNSKEK